MRFLFAAWVAAAGFLSGCSGDDSPRATGAASSGTTDGTGGGAGGGGGGGTGGTGGAPRDPSGICAELGLPVRAFAEGPYGHLRGEVADDFTVSLLDGTEFVMKERWSGCESHVFVPDRIPVSDLDDTSVWESDDDLAELVETSPRNVHWFFVSRYTADDLAAASLEPMQARVDALLAGMERLDSQHWRERLHVVAQKANSIEGWVRDALGSHGKLGFGIDRLQRVRGGGSFADVDRYNAQLGFPWEANLAYAAHEPIYFNAQALLAAELEATDATVVELFTGEVLQEFADTQVTLPSAAEMAEFDTLQIEVWMMCPNPTGIELGNCGAWDYLAHLFVEDSMLNMVELGRFITTYHREAHWVLDASQMLVHLKDGGQKNFRWSFAPPWNVQPTATKLSLRLSNSNRGIKPTQATFLWSGGAFNSGYNATHAPVDVPIPATAKKVEVFAIITGHGAATQQCAEFCKHSHEFTVNGKAYTKSHPEASTEKGCMEQIENGMTPNQAGTWWFGRGGWCPGQQVDPFVADVTADVTPGQTATVSYEGKLSGLPPPDGAGDIVLSSYLVVYE